MTPDNPVALDRYDGHMLLANSKALALAGITAKTPDPPGGVIVRDASGQPTGALKDAATELMQKAEPPLNSAQRRRAMEGALHEAAMRGVTSVQDMSLDYGDLAVYSQLLADGKLTVRVYGAPLIAESWKIKRRWGWATRSAALPWIGALKCSPTALWVRAPRTSRPYTDEPGNRGLLFSDMLPLIKAGERLMRADAPICRSAHTPSVMPASTPPWTFIKAVEKKDGPRRSALAHRARAAHRRPATSSDFAQLHVIASVQPYQAIDDGRWAEARIGHDRAGTNAMPPAPSCDHGVRAGLRNGLAGRAA